jgi:hypothetical protein
MDDRPRRGGWLAGAGGTPRTGGTPQAGALAGLAELADLVGGESDRSRRFLGGLIAGALVGAAAVGTAGAAIVRRRGGSAS